MTTTFPNLLQVPENTIYNENQSLSQENQESHSVAQLNENGNIKKKKDKEVIDSIESFIRSALKSKRVVFNDRLLRILKEKSYLNDELRSQLLEQFVSQDHMLDVSRQLMLTALNAYSFPRVAETLREFSKKVICAHSALKHISESDIFPVSAESAVKYVDVCTLFNRLIEDKNQILKSHRKDKEKKVDKKKNDVGENIEIDNIATDIKALKNALFASAAWRTLCRIETSDHILTGLQQMVFMYKPEARQRDIDLTSLLCTGSGDILGLSALISYQTWVYDQEKQKNTNYSIKLNRAESTIELTQKKLEEVSKINVEQISTISRLQQEVTALQEQRKIDLVHFGDEKEQQRSHTLKALESDVMLIAESLIALTREPPKMNVAQNYMGSVNESLQKEISYLKEQK